MIELRKVSHTYVTEERAEASGLRRVDELEATMQSRSARSAIAPASG